MLPLLGDACKKISQNQVYELSEQFLAFLLFIAAADDELGRPLEVFERHLR